MSNRKKRIILNPGGVVKELRNKKGWTQLELAEITGIADSNISAIENGRTRLGEERAILLAAAFGVAPYFLLFPNGYERPDLKDKIKKIRENLKKAS